MALQINNLSRIRDESFFQGDSIWSLAKPQEKEQAINKILALLKSDKLEDFIQSNESNRLTYGQTTTLYAVNGA